MLKAFFHRGFKKDFSKQPEIVRERFKKRFLTFLSNPNESLLRDHSLKGDLHRYIDAQTIILLRIGSHNQIY